MKIMDIQKLLGQNREISGFRIVSTKTDSYELFFVHRRLETVRATDTDTVSVTVYVNHDGKVGDSTFSVYGSMGEAEVADRIAAAAERARLVFNEPYELPEGGVLEAELPPGLRTLCSPPTAWRVVPSMQPKSFCTATRYESSTVAALTRRRSNTAP